MEFEVGVEEEEEEEEEEVEEEDDMRGDTTIKYGGSGT